MPVPFFDINNNFVVNFLPNYKRLPKWIQTIRGYISGVTWIDSVFRLFINGSDDLPFYDIAFSYSKYERIKDNYGVYESIKDNNLGNLTSDENYWFKILDSFIGSIERTSFSFHKIKLERAINRYFAQQIEENSLIGFKNPTSIDPGVGYLPLSDIYIGYLALSYLSLIAIDNLVPESSMYDIGIEYYMFDDMILGSASSFAFQINIPISVFNSINSNPVISESIIRKFIDKYNKVGARYVIVTY